MPAEVPEQGDKVSWSWGSGTPSGTVTEKKTEGEVSITSKRGNKIKKSASPANPAVAIERPGNNVVKKASELNVEEKANGTTTSEQKEEENTKESVKSKTGEKRKADDTELDKDGGHPQGGDGSTAKPAGNKKAKVESTSKDSKTDINGSEKKVDAKGNEKKKKAGRPKKDSGAPAKAKKELTPRSTEGVGSRTRSRAK